MRALALILGGFVADEGGFGADGDGWGTDSWAFASGNEGSEAAIKALPRTARASAGMMGALPLPMGVFPPAVVALALMMVGGFAGDSQGLAAANEGIGAKVRALALIVSGLGRVIRALLQVVRALVRRKRAFARNMGGFTTVYRGLCHR
jgi:hypothetical protein